MINIQGTLVNPDSTPSVNTVIRITALSTEVSLMGMESIRITSETGSYSFTLVQGDHQIEINFSDEYSLTGKVRVTADTPAELSLPALLTGYPIP